jgi:MFS family permease
VLHRPERSDTFIYVKYLLHESVWRHRDLRLLLPARALSAFGDDMTLLVLTLRVYETGLGPWSIAGLLLCAALPVVVLARVAGRLADTVPFRTLAATTALWQAACCVALALATPLWATFLLVLLLQSGHAIASPTWGALVPSIAPPDEVGRAVGASQALNTAAAVAAPAAAGLLVAWLGFAAPLLVDAATFAVLAVAALAIRTARGDARAEDGGAGAAHSAPFALRSDPLLWPLLLGLCVMVVAGEVTNVVEVFLVRDVLGAGTTAFGLLGAGMASGLVAGSLLAGRPVSQPHRALRAVLAALALALALALGGLAPSIWAFAVLWCGLGAVNGIVNVDASTLLLERTPEPARGRVLARASAMTRGSALGAMALGGLAGGLLGARATFVASGLVMALVAFAVLVRIRRALRVAGPDRVEDVDAALARSSARR